MILAGLDEAGYGPTLGPLVLAAVALRMPDPPVRADSPPRPRAFTLGGRQDPWRTLSRAVCRGGPGGGPVGSGPGGRKAGGEGVSLLVDDSKRVYQGGKGLDRLETTALACLRLALAPRHDGRHTRRRHTRQEGIDGGAFPQGPPRSPRELLEHAGLPPHPDFHDAPWYGALDLPLPLEAPPQAIAAGAGSLAAALDAKDMRLEGIRIRMIPAAEFNARVNRLDSKATLLSREHARLLGWALSLAREGEDTLVLSDAHGGRRDYRCVLAEASGEALWIRVSGRGRVATYHGEGSGRRRRTVQFAPGADSQAFPVALASIVAKYVREVWMRLLNTFFASLQPHLRATAGYPADGKRFLRDLAPTLRAHPGWEPALRRTR